MKKLVLVFIIGSMILNGCGAKEESENTLDQNLQIESENISNAETEKSNTESMVHGRRGENPAGLKTSGRNMNIGRTMSMPLQMLTLMV